MQFTFGNWLKYSTVKFMLKNENADKHEIQFLGNTEVLKHSLTVSYVLEKKLGTERKWKEEK